MVRFAQGLALLAAAAAAGVQAISTAGSSFVPGAYIVEFEDNHPDAATFYDDVAKNASKRVDLNFKLFNGASIQFHDVPNAAANADAVAAMPVVKTIWPVRLFTLPEHVGTAMPKVAPSAALPGVKSPSGTKRDANTYSTTDTFSPHLMTQVDLLRKEGVVGSGIKVAVVDTGVDYTHPALGGCFGPGCLISFGTDLVGDKYNGANTPVPDNDPMDQQGHGTHVCGIIAAQPNNPYNFTGAAPGVTLGIYKVFGAADSVGDDVLIAAFNMAYEDGVDIITSSIGGASGWTESPWSVTVERIVENGVPCTVAAGNAGADGIFFTSEAANGKSVTAIASVDNIMTPALMNKGTYTVGAGGPSTDFAYVLETPNNFNNISLPLWAVSFNTTDPANGCDPYPDSTPDLSGFIVLIHRGTCTFVQKAQNAVAKGAKYIMIYNNGPDSALSLDVSSVPGLNGAGYVYQEQGVAFVKLLAAGDTVTLSLPPPATAGFVYNITSNTDSGGFLSTYTSWGPTYELDLKPQFSSVGGNILSTWPLSLGGYAVLSGTSMATPLAAAIYSLVMEVRGIKDAKTLENLFSSTANPNLFNSGTAASTTQALAPVAQQGGGLIQAYDAAYSKTLLSVSGLAFNDTDNFSPVQSFTISNTGSSSATYTIGNIAAAAAYAFPASGGIFPATFPNTLVDGAASISFSPAGAITIPAGQRKIITVTLTPPSGLDAQRIAVYSGYITLNSTAGDSLSLPYQGVVGSMRSITVLDAPDTFLSSTTAALGAVSGFPNPVNANTTFVLPPRGQSSNPAYSSVVLPELALSLAWGSRSVIVAYIPVKLCNNNVTKVDVLGTPTLGSIASITYTPRIDLSTPSPDQILLDGSLADGTFVPPGFYKMGVWALHIFGNPTSVTDYDYTETVPFRIAYQKSK